MWTIIFQCDSTRPFDDWHPAGLAAMEERLRWRNEGTALPNSFFIAVASKLTSKGAGFIAESKEGQLDVIVLERLEAKCLIVACGEINEDEDKFEAFD